MKKEKEKTPCANKAFQSNKPVHNSIKKSIRLKRVCQNSGIPQTPKSDWEAPLWAGHEDQIIDAFERFYEEEGACHV